MPKEMEDRLQRLLDTAAVGILFFDRDGVLVDCNDGFLRMSGYTREDVRSRSLDWRRMTPPEWHDISRQQLETLLATGKIGPYEKEYFRKDGTRCWMLFSGQSFGNGEVAEVAIDISDRKRVEIALRASEERQAFLLKLNDALASLIDGAEIEAVAMRQLGEHLAVARAYYALLDDVTGNWMVRRIYAAPGVAGIEGSYAWSDFEALCLPMKNGETVVSCDITNDGRYPEDVRARLREHAVDSLILVPVVKHGTLVSTLCVTEPGPREWTASDVLLVREVAERTWQAVERARAEGALREMDARFRQFADASSDILWICNADTRKVEFVSRAFEGIYGMKREVVMGDVRNWAALVVPEDRDEALKRFEQVRSGLPSVHEFRIVRPDDGGFRWIKSAAFPLRDEHGHVHRVAGISTDITEARQLAGHQAVLLAELQHRVRNIMAMILSITARTARTAASVQDYASLMTGRLTALARTQALLTRAANAGADLGTIVRDEIAAHAQHQSQYELSGPTIVLSPKAAEVITLAMHELATNALKHGALSVATGHVTVSWHMESRGAQPWVVLDWVERGMPPKPVRPARRGFGSQLVEERIPYELRGVGRIRVEPDGAHCHLEFPLETGTSVLETDAPMRSTANGGALDVAGEPDLSGLRVLIVEDDFYLARDARRVLRGAGAEVIGPSESEASALQELQQQRPHAAVLDVDLGGGPSFRLAEILRDDSIPFVFVTGYEGRVIPAEFAQVPRIEKPAELRRIVRTVAQIVGRPPYAGSTTTALP
jgi:PAS domain S-box-containing protein